MVIDEAPFCYCAVSGIRIVGDGSCFYRGASMHRMALVHLFGRLIECNASGMNWWLVTPIERGRFVVEDVPCRHGTIAVESSSSTGAANFRTNVDDIVTLDIAHTAMGRCGRGDAHCDALYPGSRLAGTAESLAGIP